MLWQNNGDKHYRLQNINIECMNKIKWYLRKLATDFFSKWIKTFQYEYKMTEEMLMHGRPQQEQVLKREMATKLALEMLKTNRLYFSERNLSNGGRILTVKIRVI